MGLDRLDNRQVLGRGLRHQVMRRKWVSIPGLTRTQPKSKRQLSTYHHPMALYIRKLHGIGIHPKSVPGYSWIRHSRRRRISVLFLISSCDWTYPNRDSHGQRRARKRKVEGVKVQDDNSRQHFESGSWLERVRDNLFVTMSCDCDYLLVLLNKLTRVNIPWNSLFPPTTTFPRHQRTRGALRILQIQGTWFFSDDTNRRPP